MFATLMMVACTTLLVALQGAPPPARISGSMAVRRAQGVQQEDTARQRLRPPRLLPPPLAEPAAGIAVASLGRITSETIDSLVRLHPELRQLLLREYLIPSRLLPDFSPLSDRDRFAAYVRAHFPVTPFDRMSAIARGHAAAFDVPHHPTFTDYQLDIIGSIDWLLGLLH